MGEGGLTRRSFLRLGGALAAASFLGCALGATARSQQGSESLSYAVGGLEEPVEILVDRWGIPHIYASSLRDVFFAQGFNAARDRLWQIDLWRRRGLGRMSETFGSSFVEQDRAARLFLYRGEMYEEWLAYGSDTKLISEAFVEGVNAYVGLTEEDDSLLPMEFERLGYRPERWSTEDVVRIRSHGLTRNAEARWREP